MEQLPLSKAVCAHSQVCRYISVNAWGEHGWCSWCYRCDACLASCWQARVLQLSDSLFHSLLVPTNATPSSNGCTLPIAMVVRRLRREADVAHTSAPAVRLLPAGMSSQTLQVVVAHQSYQRRACPGSYRRRLASI
jgi:hypothetical protein